MQASELRHIISFQSSTTSTDSMGGRTSSAWVTDRTSRAMIEPTGGDVAFENGQTRGSKNFTITCRYLPDYEITHKTRILWDGRELIPNVPINIDTLKKFMTFEAMEFTK